MKLGRWSSDLNVSRDVVWRSRTEALICILEKLHNASRLSGSLCVMKYLIDKNAAVISLSWGRGGVCVCGVVLSSYRT